MDSILRDAIARRDAALAEANKWSDFVRLYEELQRGHALHIGLPDNTEGPSAASRPPVRQPVKVKETEAAAVAAIRRLGSPLPTRRILEELESQGVEIGGKEPIATLTARLSRAASLIYERPHGWKVREEPPQTNETAAPMPREEAAASHSQPPNDADRRGEVVHDNMTA